MPSNETPSSKSQSAPAGAALSRRDFLSLSAALGAHAVLAADLEAREATEAPLSGLATGLPEERDYAPRLEGRLPRGLRGTLYRNGPGLFERDGYRKRCILDGDGMIQAFDFQDGRLRYRNRFVRTEKYREEQAAGRYLHETWTTRAPGGMLSNLGPGIKSQAGVSVHKRDGRLFAFDEYSLPHELDSTTLATIGEKNLGATGAKFAAHPKFDSASGQWIHFGLEEGRRMKIHLTVLDARNRLVRSRVMTADRHYYMHDFFVTANHIVLNLQPAIFSLGGFLAGMNSLVDGLRWKPELGNTLLVFDRRDLDAEPLRLEAPACWMWHALNAYETKEAGGGQIVAEFVGVDRPDAFLGDDPVLYALMEGREVKSPHPGKIRRYRIDLRAKKVKTEILAGENHEFPILHPGLACRRHRYGYFVQGDRAGWPFTAVRRLDMRTGKSSRYDFGANFAVGEAVFAPAPESLQPDASGPGVSEPGWLLSLVYDRTKRKSFLAILDAENLTGGPLAKVHLRHHSPLSFHGIWAPA